MRSPALVVQCNAMLVLLMIVGWLYRWIVVFALLILEEPNRFSQPADCLNPRVCCVRIE
jgi:hypothetical protein